MLRLSRCLCVVPLFLIAGVSQTASGATLALTSAPGAELAVVVTGNGTPFGVSIDLSTRLHSSLSSEPFVRVGAKPSDCVI